MKTSKVSVLLPRFDKIGLVPVVVQNENNGAILMLAYADRRALEETLRTGLAHFYSRSRERLWKKGETSGNVMRVAGVSIDCDGDAVIYRVVPAGPACHTGKESCFWRSVIGSSLDAEHGDLKTEMIEVCVGLAGVS
ncbi:MAG: phosphoribosyl-AMP cyclohydrolase [Patescibacteria group bacterium]|nr:phosphoribosyl-AMP cyclohydrolase [Patescibacteria group bacterium]